MRTPSLNSVLDWAVQYALLSGLVGCVTQGADGRQSGVSQGEVSADTNATDVTPSQARGSTDPPIAGFEKLACTAEQPWNFANMNFARAIDFIALRRVVRNGTAMELATHGQACLGENAGTCAAALQAASPAQASEWGKCSPMCMYHALVTTQGDEVQVLQTRSAIKELLGPIDSLDEAALWVQANNGDVSCDSASGRTTDGGYEIAHDLTLSFCLLQTANVVDRVSAEGTIVEVSRDVQPETNICVGRRPEGLLAVERADTGQRVGDYFAEVAQLEAAAVKAFDKIHAELCAFGAPQALLQQVHGAREDEVRHTAQMAALARCYGGTPHYPKLPERPLRCLFDAARDNMIEGCVRETFGAACAQYQARQARDAEVRRVLTQVAADETRHAELSWALHAWFLEQLTPAQREQLERDRVQAILQLRKESQRPVPPEINIFAGVPSEQHALALLDALDAELWQTARAA